jgi:hypothetical protein
MSGRHMDSDCRR